jgi:hypothetical protein
MRQSSIQLEFSRERPETFEVKSPDSKLYATMGAPNAEVNFKRLVHQVRMVEEVECDIDEDVDNEHF